MSKTHINLTVDEEVALLMKIHKEHNYSQIVNDILRHFFCEQLNETPERKQLLIEIEETKKRFTELLSQKAISDSQIKKQQKIADMKFKAIKKYGIDGFLPDD